MIFEWITGRSLDTITKGNTEIIMKYDCNGMRTQKKVGNDITNYYYDSSNNLIGLTNGNNTLFFYYDSYGMPTSFAHNGTMYYYVKNLQGDIVQITKQDGTVVAKYVYDVWGKILSIKDGSNNTIETTNATHLANLNPFRYRGYVYDNETGLYYLQSRYYDPITGRFLNADVYCDTGSENPLSTNMFAYCENNAVINLDYKGTYSIKKFNCYAYAVGINNKWLCPGTQGLDKYKTFLGVRPPFSVEKLAKTVVSDLFCLGISSRRVKSKNSRLEKGEYLIALRVAKFPSEFEKDKYNYDFHFMKKDPKSGKWWTKSGQLKIICKGKIDPDNKSNWGVPGDYNYKSVAWIYPYRSNKKYYIYYNSHTEYIAIKTRFWTK